FIFFLTLLLLLYFKGSVIINCSYQQDKGNDKYFCKESTNQCVYMKSDQRQNSWDHKGRVSLNNFHGGLMVTYRDLSLEDAGLYQCGGTGVWNSCCLGPKTVIGYAGETTTISFSYPEEFQTEYKLLFKLDGQVLTALMDTNLSQKDRFSISDNRRSRVVSVRISDVREEDGGVYYCAVGDGGDEVVQQNILLEPKSMVGYLGESVTINCYYQEEFQTNDKYFYKLSDGEFIEVIHSTDSQKGRFSISDNRSSRVFSVRISDVIEDDKGVYYCGVEPLFGLKPEVRPVGSVDVIGYSGGTVIMTCKWNRLTKSFCKTSPSNTCESTIYTTDRGRWFNRDRLYLFEEFYNQLVVLYRRLVPEDTGSYQCAESGTRRYTINLRVKSDPCCLGPKNMTGHLGETITISCSYPEEFQTEKKFLYKLEGPDFSELISTSESRKNRFSISEDRSSRVVRVRIRDVREEDRGDYFCGVKFNGQAVNYVSLFNEVQLQVAGEIRSFFFSTETKPDLTTHKPNQKQKRPNQTKPNQTSPHTNQTKPNQTKPDLTTHKPNQTKPNQTKPNQTKPNQTKPNQTKPNQTKPNQTRLTKPDQT
uniref:Ig-like domain-containing protein n=1 Tax=Astyanax mexicanus TaxID=7994 RepID=A0A3B1IYF4_ASTMX